MLSSLSRSKQSFSNRNGHKAQSPILLIFQKRNKKLCGSCKRPFDWAVLLLLLSLIAGLFNLILDRQVSVVNHIATVTGNHAPPSNKHRHKNKNTSPYSGLHKPSWRIQKQSTNSHSSVNRPHINNNNNNNNIGVEDDPYELPPPSLPTHTACANTKGILHIAMGDIGGAAGTVLLQFVLGQLIYAEQNNLTPWVHFNNISYIVYDNQVHNQGPGVTLFGFGGRNATTLSIRSPKTQGGHWRDQYPGPLDENLPVKLQKYHFPGTGLWRHYFMPVSDFVPGDQSCADKLYVTLDLFSITPGIHGFAPWAPRCWRYHYLPEYVTKPYLPLMQWLAPYRKIGSEAAKKYIKFRPYLYKAAESVNPSCSDDSPCLGLHIRHSDKSAGRRVINTTEFLPYAQAFVLAGGQHVYVATDSALVLDEIYTTWPVHVRDRVRHLGGKLVDTHNNNNNKNDDVTQDNAILRSTNNSAVFDLYAQNHHLTNQQALTEILALSKCQFLVHGLSAVSEAAIWINYDLDSRSVNLEDDEFDKVNSQEQQRRPDRLSPALFATMVQMTIRKQRPWPLANNNNNLKIAADSWRDAWLEESRAASRLITHTACDGKDGVLLISSVGVDAMAGGGFFTSVINQLIYAEMHNLIPYVHIRKEADNLYDPAVHDNVNMTMEMMFGMGIRWIQVPGQSGIVVPGEPKMRSDKLHLRRFILPGNGIWETYFEPVSAYRTDDMSCRVKPLVAMDEKLVSDGLNTFWPTAVKSWHYDVVPVNLWNPNKLPLKEWMAPMRLKGHEIVNKYYRFLTYIKNKADQVNPVKPGESCLAVHFRNSEKKGKFRRKIRAPAFLPYIEAFVQAGGKTVYVASDSQRTIQYIERNFPEYIVRIIRQQGNDIVRTYKEYPLHAIADHHRVNSEVLVDILAMSKCQFLVHTFSTVAEASIYINPDLHNNSVNLEDPGKLDPEDFKKLVKNVLETDALTSPLYFPAVQTPTTTSAETKTKGPIVTASIVNTTVIYRSNDMNCHKNAIIYLAQKTRSNDGRDSYNTLLKSIDLLHKNYLSINNHISNTDVFIFHNGDFNEQDLEVLEHHLGQYQTVNIRFVDLTSSPYWSRPSTLVKDDPTTWHVYPLFSEGYRRMMSWYAVEVWNFFESYNQELNCQYRYIMRLDQDSYIHSPIHYDMFDFMKLHGYVYGFRMCSYEMKKARFVWNSWASRHKEFAPKRTITPRTCGFYNNFFISDLNFFLRKEVKTFLHSIKRQGVIYRRRLGDLLIHTMVVYAFAESRQVHRFLDFTYEHGTVNQTSGCVTWGGIQAGYKDDHALDVLEQYYQEKLLDRPHCKANATFLYAEDLSPTYAHLSDVERNSLSLYTIAVERVEIPGMGVDSG